MLAKKNYSVSILIVVWNEKKFFNTSFNSVRNQIFNDYEIICVNNGSMDKSLEEILKWQKIFSPERFKIINNETNIGLTRALNLALKKARGKYIARIDPDDSWEKGKLEKQVNFLENNQEYGIIGCNHTNICKNNKKIIKLPETHEAISEKLFRRNPFAHSCILARTDLIKKIGAYDETIKYGQDYELWLRCFPLTKFYNIQEFLCDRTINDVSVRKQNAQMWQSIKTRIKYIRKYKYSWKNYLYLFEPLMIILTPNFIKNIKRKYL